MKPQETVVIVRFFKGLEEVCKNQYVWFTHEEAKRYAKEKEHLFGADKVMFYNCLIGDKQNNPAYQLWNLIKEVKDDADTPWEG